MPQVWRLTAGPDEEMLRCHAGWVRTAQLLHDLGYNARTGKPLTDADRASGPLFE